MSTFTYYPSLPNPPDYPGDDAPGMQTNAGSIAGIIAQDHVAFNTSGGGKHVQSTYIQNTSDPVLAGTDIAVYGKAVAGVTQLFVELSSGAVIQLTSAATTSGAAGPPPTYAGSIVLTGGIIMKWGNVVVSSSGTTTVVFPIAFPTACFGVQMTVNATGAPTQSIVTDNYPTRLQFVARINGPSNQNCFWVALGI